MLTTVPVPASRVLSPPSAIRGQRLAVVVPTRNRPEKLGRCLSALVAAREHREFDVVVCDASDNEALRARVRAVCEQYPRVTLRPHTGKNAAAARNACAAAADADLLVSVDDDVYVEPRAVARLVERYEAGAGWRVVAGSVRWGVDWSSPVRMRRIGYGRKAAVGEEPDFVVGAFFLYPRELALQLPWNERIRTSEDRFMGAVWKAHAVSMMHEPGARAVHDDQHNSYGVEHQRYHIYANLFDAVFTRRSFSWTLCYELLGFAAGAKLYFRRPATAAAFVAEWLRGNSAFVRDLVFLRSLAVRKLSPPAEH